MTPYEHADAMAEAIDNIVALWEKGDLAGAVNDAEAAAQAWRTELNQED